MDDKVITEYLRRSYFSVDGLWFMMIEKQYSFDKALEIDIEVWKILPKIQARKVKEMLSLEGKGVSDFVKALTVKLQAEEYDYSIEQENEDHIRLVINKCPWLEIMKKAKREHLAPIISNAICPIEFGVWLSEFGLDMRLDRQAIACDGSHQCIWDWHKR